MITVHGAPEPIAALNKIKIIETEEPLIDLRSIDAPIRLASGVLPYVRQTVAKMLVDAQKQLPDGHFIFVHDALRPLEVQQQLWDEYYERVKALYPDWPVSTLKRITNKYVAPYDQPTPPGHCTGGALDITLVNAKGKELDFHSPLPAHKAQATWVGGLSAEAQYNRQLLVGVMLKAGFSNCKDEYWHYSYGDSAWAVRTGQTTCPYGLMTPPRSQKKIASKIRVFCYDTDNCDCD